MLKHRWRRALCPLINKPAEMSTSNGKKIMFGPFEVTSQVRRNPIFTFTFTFTLNPSNPHVACLFTFYPLTPT